ncbi:13220_t:CDS:1 [Entrophospora sp. SA101]|nr:13421_t:CDS:1 [Entrophospora sp. SA101]CAJ0745071.1 13220_t:CDS:1 [Entrophospora sp. SA101]CAJ0826081.1 8691_t:CDS:1 [Entrophospora sp. SA101]CAJ0843025.1 16715_t:CDS:1 [Entrophospora sp. SA101]CAJ0849931.1 4660_t:CDS:1 [Entrophospora sp. SA101]
MTEGKNKNIVVLCDGTWNGQSSLTNIFKLSKEIVTTDDQKVEYDVGLGIGDRPIEFLLNGALAVDLDEKIKKAYRFIVSNYQHGDDIWLFGFSRGAYTARCVAGMMNTCGILKENDDKLIDIAYQNYRNHPNGRNSIEFKDKFSYKLEADETPIKFLGLYDTVGAYGIPRYVMTKGIDYYELFDQHVSHIVKYAFQASAIHDCFPFFEPCPIKDNGKTICKQTWFPGVHIEVGGGTSFGLSGDQKIPTASLLWMIENIFEVGGLKMRHELEYYRTVYAPEYAHSWNVPSYIIDRGIHHFLYSIKYIRFISFLFIQERKIPLVTEPGNKYSLKKDLLFNDGDWNGVFINRKQLRQQYISRTYENLRDAMKEEDIYLPNNIEF